MPVTTNSPRTEKERPESDMNKLPATNDKRVHILSCFHGCRVNDSESLLGHAPFIYFACLFRRRIIVSAFFRIRFVDSTCALCVIEISCDRACNFHFLTEFLFKCSVSNMYNIFIMNLIISI